jgi:HEAT repeat protein
MQALLRGPQVGRATVVVLAICACAACGSSAAEFAEADELSKAAELTEAEVAEIRRIETRLENGDLPQPPLWNCCTCPSEEGIQEMLRVGVPRVEFIGKGDLLVAVSQTGGWKKFKADVATLLNSKDPTIRRYAAVLLADLGDAAYAENLIELATRERPLDHTEVFGAWDRAMAAMAIGTFRDKKHATVLLKLMGDRDPLVRGCAARGLGWMKASEFHGEIAKLLDDEHEYAVEGAMWALGKLKATQYVDRLVTLATGEWDRRREGALATLAALDARGQAAKIAELLEPSRSEDLRNQAAVTLAMLDAREHIPTVAAMLDDESSFTKAHAATALAVWKASDEAPKLAALLTSKDSIAREAAAWSLIVMESKPYARAALAVAAERSDSSWRHCGLPRGTPYDDYWKWVKRFESSRAKLQAAVE